MACARQERRYPPMSTVALPVTADTAPLRNERWDAMRGVAILCVVVIHAIGPTYFARGGSNASVGVVLRQITAFAVPLFLCISGYWNRNITTRNSAEYVAFVSRRVRRVLVPYVIWSFVYLGIAAIQLRDRSILLSPSAVARALLTGGASAPLDCTPGPGQNGTRCSTL